MDILVALFVFIVAMLCSLIKNFSMTIALLAGLIAFIIVGMKRGYQFRELCKMSIDGNRNSLVVIEVMCMIGFLTASWRVSGTISIFVYYGIKIITPSLFLIIAFLLSCLLSYAIGSSFGVAGTVGIVFMALAKSGGVDSALTAGILMSGIYFGDRCSPVSASANMVAAVTDTKILDNVKMMMKTGFLPWLICFACYIALSFANPLTDVNADILTAFEREFTLSKAAFIPAILMLCLPLLRIGVLLSMSVSIISAILIAWFVQGVPLAQILKICIMGYYAEGSTLGNLLDGGGMISMLGIVAILLIVCNMG